MSCCSDDEQNHINKTFQEKDYRYHVQIGLFRNYNQAMNFQLKLFEDGVLSDIERQGELYTLYVGDFTEIDKAVILELFLRYLGYNTMMIAI